MIKILVVDDDNLIRKSLADMLRSQQYEVIEAVDGSQGLEQALTHQPNLIITDVQMPAKTGIEMINDLRQDSWGKTVPVIVLSNDESTGSINQVLQSGATVYLAKSATTPDSILDQIKTALGQ
ncbi:MAG: response regulator [Candidatus Saccharimonadales bacterium]